MAVQRVTLRLTEIRCVKELSAPGGLNPYLWVTYFAFPVAQQLPGQTGPVATITPAYDDFRTDFPDHIKAGQAVNIPPFIATASFDMDLDIAHKLVGCIAILMEENQTPDSSIILGRIAYSKEIDKQLNDLAKKRILANDFGPITDAEINAIKTAVQAKVEAAVGSNQTIWNVFTTQDENLGFTYKAFFDSDIKFQYFDFPEIGSANSPSQFVLSGGLSTGPVPPTPVDLCAAQRAAVKAKNDQIAGLQSRVAALQNQLQHATPQEKSGIVSEIKDTNNQITQALAELPALQAALNACIAKHHHPPVPMTHPTVHG